MNIVTKRITCVLYKKNKFLMKNKHFGYKDVKALINFVFSAIQMQDTHV